MKGRAAQTIGRLGDRYEGSSSGSLRVAFVSGGRMSMVRRALRRRRLRRPALDALARVGRPGRAAGRAS